jgi:hypothetical protein
MIFQYRRSVRLESTSPQMFSKLAHLMLVLLSLAGLLRASPQEAQKDYPWVEVPAAKPAPTFRYQARLVDHELHVRVQTAGSFPLEKWILRFWVSDPRMEVKKTARKKP